MQDSTGSAAVAQIDFVVRSMCATAIEREKYFGDLDAVVGDGDFGYSLARGFEAIAAELDTYDRSNGGAFLKKIAMVVMNKVGGTSGPLWGTGFLRAAAVAGEKPSLSRADAAAMLLAAAEGIKQRGQSDVGDKTLLDALIPAAKALADDATAHAADSAADAAARVAGVARESADATKTLVAKRGRASYSGERSIGSVDAGAVAIAVMLEDLSNAYRTRTGVSK